MRVPRCSRPLCSSQTTTPYHTPPHPAALPATKDEENNHETHEDHAARKPETPKPAPRNHATLTGHAPHATALLPQDPTVCQTQKPDNPLPAPFHNTPPHQSVTEHPY